MGRLKDQVAIITGATSGIGLACAERFAAEGAHVVLCGRRQEVGAAVAARMGRAATFLACDVTLAADLEALVATTLERHGRIDCVISNAGTVSATATIPLTDPAAFDQDFALHVRAPFLAMKYAAPAMIAAGRGNFINISSISGHRAGFNTFGYEVAKAAIVHLTRCAALEFGETGVRANAISPGPTLTGIFGKHAGDEATADARMAEVEAVFTRLLPAVQPLPGMIHAQDIANAALFLASDEGRYVNGHNLVVDGGISAGRPAAVMRANWEAIASALSPDPDQA